MTSNKHPEKAQKKPASTLEWLLGRVEAYLDQNPHITAPGFGMASVGDTGLVKRLRAGHDVTTRKFDSLVRYMGNPNKERTDNGKQTEEGKKQKDGGKKGKALEKR